MKNIPAAVIVISLLFAAAAQASYEVVIDKNAGGRIYEGFGMVNSSGTSKLLYDYPEPQRSRILDFLFKPDFGAGLTIIKNEIGSDTNSSSGTEPSHMRSENEEPSARGANFFICREAKKRNPEIKFGAGRWGIPAWASKSIEAKKKYYLAYVKVMKDNGTPLDFLSPDENENRFSRDWVVKVLRPALDEAGYKGLELVAKDGLNWEIADMVHKDKGLRDALGSLNIHYNTYSTPAALQSGFPLYNDEADTPMRSIWKRLMFAGINAARQYIKGRMTRLLYQPALDSVYDSIKFNCKGIITANTPWNGHYEVHKSLWMTAHFTQFAKPGWSFIDDACGSPGPEEAFVTLKSPDSNDYSVVIINNGENNRDYSFKIKGFSGKKVHAWMTTDKEQFIRKKNVKIKNSSFSITVPKGSIISLTTTTGQKKGKFYGKPPKDKPLKLPYTYDFGRYEKGSQPEYFYDQAGAFEAAEIDGVKCAAQVITDPPVEWWAGISKKDPYTIFGDQRWMNYSAGVDVLCGRSGTALISVRGILHNRDADVPPSGYQLKISGNGSWVFRKTVYGETTDFASGKIKGFRPDKWHNIRVEAAGEEISAYIDGKKSAYVKDRVYASGQASIGSNYEKVYFNNLKIEPVKGMDAVCSKADDKKSSFTFGKGWEMEDGNWMDYCRGSYKSNKPGAEAIVTFSGTGFIVSGRLGSNSGKADIYIDGKKAGETYSLHSDTVFRAKLFEANGLRRGKHKVKIIVKDDGKGKKDTGLVYVDSVEYH